MSKSKMLGLIAMAVAGFALTAEPVLASPSAPSPQTRLQAAAAERNADRQRRTRAAISPEAAKAASETILSGAGIACDVTEAVSPGRIGEDMVYEAACATGPGYLLIASTPPSAIDCIELAGTAAIARARDPEADVGQQCALPANQNVLAVIGGWAREAGVTCSVDQAQAIGKSGPNLVYEVGCANADGYWLEKEGANWVVQECLVVNSTGGTCRFTTPQEQAAGFQSKLAGTDAASCNVAQVRLMGQNANGRFYEAKCTAEGEGYIARVDTAGATQQVYPCATAQRIGGGCTLTPAPAEATEQ